MKLMLDLVQRHKAGQPVGIYSVCSAHPIVIEAALRAGLRNDAAVLIEATSNQVNQFGGYTGMTPVLFKQFVLSIAKRVNLPETRIIFGGDHLGPNCWQSGTAEQAMQKSEILIHDYVAAGFKKIHLDCSMSCADDPVPLSDEMVAQRAARLCAVAEQTWQATGGEAPVYVVGTEVPVPGGAHEDLAQLAVTSPQAAAATIAAHKNAFAHLGTAWLRVIALVVQPGVEFDHHKVIDYLPGQAVSLSRFIESEPSLIYEAHSTDYQNQHNLNHLVRDHFAILKVGPAVTFALREALWALADIETALLGHADFKRTVLEVMRAQPQYWNKYYCDPANLEIDLQFSLSDRIRYYWTQPTIQQAQTTMLASLAHKPIPLTLLSQYLPNQYQAIRNGLLQNNPEQILLASVAAVLHQYHLACTSSWSTTCH
jgi:D-tagatose-1,6-bisphosphate aldolase subunit GatZ/KbaZ